MEAMTRGSPGSISSGAPSTQEPALPKEAPLHLRAEEKGTVAVGSHPAGAEKASASACMVALGLESAAASAPRGGAGSWRSSSTSSDSTASRPSVRVPVLSKQMTSTRASPSTAGSSCTSTRCWPSRTTPTAKATEVSSTSPSGTMAAMPATVARRASLTPMSLSRFIWLQTSRTTVGTITQAMVFRMRLMPLRNSLRTRVKRFASSARRTA